MTHSENSTKVEYKQLFYMLAYCIKKVYIVIIVKLVKLKLNINIVNKYEAKGVFNCLKATRAPFCLILFLHSHIAMLT